MIDHVASDYNYYSIATYMVNNEGSVHGTM